MTGQASICFGLASFSLYLRRFYHFSLSIKRTKSKVIAKPDAAIASEQKAQAIFSKIDNLVKKLQTSADAGNKEARDKLNFFRWDTLRALMRDLEKMSKAGQHASPPPIRTILEIADFSIPLLFELTELQKENIKGYALGALLFGLRRGKIFKQ
jgi:hypothetical protein